MASKCPCVNEKIGTVDDFVRMAISRAPKERSVDEVLKGIKVKFKVEVKRWDGQGYGDWLLHYDSEEKSLDDLLTNGGRDLIHNASFMTGAQPAALTYYAVCNPAGAFTPDPTDTTLNTETTAPTQMARHVCTGIVDGVTESFTHGTGGNTTVVICGFKNNGGAPVTNIKGYGNFNLVGPPPAGTLGTESSFATLDLGISDILKLSVTLTLG